MKKLKEIRELIDNEEEFKAGYELLE